MSIRYLFLYLFLAVAVSGWADEGKFQLSNRYNRNNRPPQPPPEAGDPVKGHRFGEAAFRQNGQYLCATWTRRKNAHAGEPR